MKKKYGLFKVLSVLLVLIIFATYLIDSRQGTKIYLALGDVFFNYLQSFNYFFDTALFIMVVGGFYGVLNKIPAYKEMVKGIANKMEDKSKLFVIIMTIVFALVSTLTGLNVILLLVVPMVVSIVLLLGYDKLVALSTTIGGIIIGLVSGIFLTVKDPASYYSVSYTTIDKLVGLNSHYANIIPKVVLLVLGLGLLIWYMLSHIKKEGKKNTYELSKSDALFVEVKDKTGKKVKEENTKKVMKCPLYVVFGLLFVLLVLGYLPWVDLFEVEVFNDFHNWLLGLKIGDYEIVRNLGFTILSTGNGSIDLFEVYGAFGAWAGFGNYMMAMIVVVIFTFILMLVYRVKFDDAMDGFMYGVKKMLLAVLTVVMAYSILICSYNHGFVETLINMASDKFGDNAIVHSLVTMLGSVINVDLYYTANGIFTSIASTLSGSANLSVYALMFQSLYGLVQVIGPTSILLIVGLSYLEVPYKSWLKYIWRFVVELLIVILVVLMIVSLI